MIPGEIIFGDDQITCNADKEAVALTVLNSGDRPVQVGSHFHFFEANDALQFDRASAWGKRLDIAAGTAVRFEAGQTITVNLIDMGGKRRVFGFNGKVNGYLDAEGARPASGASQSGSQADAQSGSQSGSQADAQSDSQAGSQVDAHVGSHAGSQAKPQADSRTDTYTDSPHTSSHSQR